MQLEKIHSTTLIYRCCLGFNLQSQNQVLNTHELLKPSNSPPRRFLWWYLLTWQGIEVFFTDVAPHQPSFVVTASLGPTCHYVVTHNVVGPPRASCRAPAPTTPACRAAVPTAPPCRAIAFPPRCGVNGSLSSRHAEAKGSKEEGN
jgi:hypothetical protein